MIRTSSLFWAFIICVSLSACQDNTGSQDILDQHIPVLSSEYQQDPSFVMYYLALQDVAKNYADSNEKNGVWCVYDVDEQMTL